MVPPPPPPPKKTKLKIQGIVPPTWYNLYRMRQTYIRQYIWLKIKVKNHSKSNQDWEKCIIEEGKGGIGNKLKGYQKGAKFIRVVLQIFEGIL